MKGLLWKESWIEGVLHDLRHLRNAWLLLRRVRSEGYDALEIVVKAGKFTITEATKEEAREIMERGWVEHDDHTVGRVITPEEIEQILGRGWQGLDGTLPDVNPRRYEGDDKGNR